MTEIVIEPYSEKYRDDVQKLILEIQQLEFHIDIDITRQPDLSDIPNFYQTGKGNFWIARSQNAVFGTIALLDIGDHQTALRKMFVDKNLRGSEWRVSEKLLFTLFDWSKHKGIKEFFWGQQKNL